VALALAWASVAWAQPAPPPGPAPLQPIPDAILLEGDEAVPPPAAPAAPPSARSSPEEKPPLFPLPSVAAQTHVGVHAAVNIGLLAVDLHVNRSYTFIAGNLGVPLVTNGDLGAFALGSGYSYPLSPPGETMWVLDLFGVVNPGWQAMWNSGFTSYSAQPFVGLGVGVGFRMLHWSGFTFGLKIPVFGAAINGGTRTSESVATFYLANAISLPIVSFGLHW
jgi:hypothetical protein